MRVVCLIDSLGSGGAQRQLCTIAVLLKHRGMDVSVLTYHPHDFFFPLLREAGIQWTCLQTRSPARHFFAVRQALQSGDQDVVLTFLDGPNFYAELAGIPRRSWGLVVSERSARPENPRGRQHWLRQIHRLADAVTTNSHSNRLMIERSAKALRSRTVTIYNAVDLGHFQYTPPPNHADASFRIAVVASYHPNKNLPRFIEALSLARRMVPTVSIQVDWYGGFTRRQDGTIDAELYDNASRQIASSRLHDIFRLHRATDRVDAVYRHADAVALPSLFEGLPNTVCEGMATGRPILMSNVCDASNLVKQGANGFLFNPLSMHDMANAIVAMATLSAEEKKEFGARSRAMAERLFSGSKVGDHYARILTDVASKKPIMIQHWTPDVPASAYRSLEGPKSIGNPAKRGPYD